MKASTLVIVLASLGYILMGGLSLKSKKIKKLLQSSGVYNDINSFIKINGIFNILMGIVGIILGCVDYLLIKQSKYIVILFIISITILSFIQKGISKKYKNI